MRRFPIRRASVLLTAGIVLALAALSAQEQDARAEVSDVSGISVLEARVSKILDGDTITLSGVSRRIRIWGLDAPEWNHAGGSAATAAMRALVAGQMLRCELRDMDRYGRHVAQCFLPDGRDIAREMIRMGVATEYCFFSRGYYGTC